MCRLAAGTHTSPPTKLPSCSPAGPAARQAGQVSALSDERKEDQDADADEDEATAALATCRPKMEWLGLVLGHDQTRPTRQTPA